MILKNIKVVHPISRHNTFAEVYYVDKNFNNTYKQHHYLFLDKQMKTVAHFIGNDFLLVEHLSEKENNIFVLTNLEKKTCEIVQVEPFNKYSSINVYDDIEFGVEDSTFAVQKDGLWGFIDELGQEIIPCQYKKYCSFSQNLAAVQKDNKWGFINKKGETVIPFDYEIPQFSSFDGDIAPVFKENKAGYIDKQGNVVISFKYEDAGISYHDSCIFPVKLKGKWGFVDKDEYVKIPFIYDNVECDGDCYPVYHVTQNGKIGLVSPIIGREIIPAIYDDLCVNEKSVVVRTVSTNGNKITKILDWNNNLITQEEYDYISDYIDEGFYVAHNNKKYGYLNEKGEVAIPLKYRQCNDFVGGITIATNFDFSKEVIDKNGDILLKTTPEQNIFNVGNGYVFVEKENSSEYELLKICSRKDK